MKKYICLSLISTLILTTCISVFGCNLRFWKKKPKIEIKQEITVDSFQNANHKEKNADLEILPTMNSESNAKNQVWVGTFQLIWNDLVNEIIKSPVQFAGYESIVAENLNKQSFTSDDISENSYYKKWGLVSDDLKNEIKTAIKEKFNETSDIIDKFDWTPDDGKYFLYAMLKKDFEYPVPFDKLESGNFSGSNGFVKYFGINRFSNYQTRNIVHVLFYNNKNDYAVMLKTKQGDNVLLYRTDDDKTLDLYYKDMLEKSENFSGKKYMTQKDEFKAPVIEFKSEQEFNEICNKQIINSNFFISKALETVQFKMDETGVKLKSEAGMMVALTSLPNREEIPRYFYFDNKYIIFLQETDKKPYFAMKVTDAKLLQKD